MSDVILLVAQLDLSSLRNVVRLLLTLSNDEAMGNKVRVVLNRVGGDCDISLPEGRGDHRQTDLLANPQRSQADDGIAQPRGALLQHAPKSKVQQSIVGLARALTGKAPAEVKEKSKGWSLFRAASNFAGRRAT